MLYPTLTKARCFLVGGQESHSANNLNFSTLMGIGITQTVETLVQTLVQTLLKVKRMTITVSLNSKNGDTTVQLRDDQTDVPNTLITIGAGLTGQFDTGAISETINEGSLIDVEKDTTASASGNIAYACLVECEP